MPRINGFGSSALESFLIAKRRMIRPVMQSNSRQVVSPARWTADHSLLGEGAYEHRRTSFDWFRDAACFARWSWLQSAQASVVGVGRRADTPRGSAQHYCAHARCILRSAVEPAAPAWRVTAERAA